MLYPEDSFVNFNEFIKLKEQLSIFMIKLLIKLLMKITTSDHFTMIIMLTESSICDQLQFNGLFQAQGMNGKAKRTKEAPISKWWIRGTWNVIQISIDSFGNRCCERANTFLSSPSSCFIIAGKVKLNIQNWKRLFLITFQWKLNGRQVDENLDEIAVERKSNTKWKIKWSLFPCPTLPRQIEVLALRFPGCNFPSDARNWILHEFEAFSETLFIGCRHGISSPVAFLVNLSR